MSAATEPSWMLPLEGVTSAPFAARQLADLGTRVAKVQRPGDFARSYDGTVSGMARDERFGPMLPGLGYGDAEVSAPTEARNETSAWGTGDRQPSRQRPAT